MLEKMDDYLLAKLEVVINQITRVTGKDNYFWAKIFMCLTLAFDLLLSITQKEYYYIANDAIGAPIIFLVIQSEEQEAVGRRQNGLANPFKLQFFGYRILCDILIPLMWLVIFVKFTLSMNVTVTQVQACYIGTFLWVSLYLLSCDVAPPEKSLIGEWLDSLGKQPIPVTVSNK